MPELRKRGLQVIIQALEWQTLCNLTEILGILQQRTMLSLPRIDPYISASRHSYLLYERPEHKCKKKAY